MITDPAPINPTTANDDLDTFLKAATFSHGAMARMRAAVPDAADLDAYVAEHPAEALALSVDLAAARAFLRGAGLDDAADMSVGLDAALARTGAAGAVH
jgi:hypothetical protein